MTAVVHMYRPRGAARDLMHTRAGEVLLAGPAGTGKSRGCLEKMLAVMVKYPGAHGLIVRQVAASLPASALRTWREDVAREAIDTGRMSWYGGSRETPPQYRFGNGSSIIVSGMDKPSKIMSTDYDLIFVQEATELSLDGWEALTTRLRHGVVPYQQLMADANPDSATHWLKQRADAGSTVMLHSQHRDNPRLYDDDGQLTTEGSAYMAVLDKLTGVRRYRLRDGLWVAAEGVIYDQWSPHLNVREPFSRPPQDWPRYWTIDFGTTNPFVWQCWVEHPDGQLIMYREVYMTGRMVTDHAERILKMVTYQREDWNADDPDERESRIGQWKEPKPEVILCDHDADGRLQLEKVLGLPTQAANKSVSVKDGIEAVQLRMQPRVDGTPGLRICEGALVEMDQELKRRGLPTCTMEELGSYVWNPSKDQPVKENDHGMDAMRYLVVHKDLGGDFNIRWI